MHPRRRTFVGLGFGPIQGGLFLYEAGRSGNFTRLVVAEVMADVVTAVRQAGGWYSVNIAHSDRVEASKIGPVEIEYPGAEPDRRHLVAAVAEAEEIATAVPSVRDYVSEGPGSIHRVLAEGLRRKASLHGPRAVVYAAENHNHAAEILEAAVLGVIPESERAGVNSRVRFLNTVIGKMSGVVSGSDVIRARGLTQLTESTPRAFLVEAFNRILISGIRFETAGDEPAFRRGIEIFAEKEDLIPFEEAKLFGHNATHALAAYVGAVRGVRRIADLREFPDIMNFLRTAFIDESGAALIRRHSGVDRLFTTEGYCAYADDLLARMLNPCLQDTVERVGRDAQRKLGWDDRLVGTIRVALRQGISPRRYALGAAAALATLDSLVLTTDVPVAGLLERIWKPLPPDKPEKAVVLDLIEEGRCLLKNWRQSEFQNLEGRFHS